MKREIKSRKIFGLWRSVIRFGVTWICATGILNLLGIPVATAVAEMPQGAAFAAGFSHSCVILADGCVQCWGHVHFGTLGKQNMSESATPVPVDALATAVVVAGKVDQK